jgi:thiamine pyrophosphokinase
MAKQANLFLNGRETRYMHSLDRSLYTLCADGGLRNALANGVRPDAVLGDGDSLHEYQERGDVDLNGVPFIEAADQDHTDFEKALYFLQERGYRDIRVYCFEGDRLDHMLAGLSAVTTMKKLRITVHTSTQRLWLLPRSFKLSCRPGETVSLIPFPYAGGVSTAGLRWNLDGHNLELGVFLSISNTTEAEEIQVSCTTGTLFLAHSPTEGL